MTLDKNQIQTIEAKAKLATGMDWYVGTRDNHVLCSDFEGGEEKVVADCSRLNNGPQNADFIASARTDIPALCQTALALMDEVERLKGALVRIWDEDCEHLEDDLSAVRMIACKAATDAALKGKP